MEPTEVTSYQDPESSVTWGKAIWNTTELRELSQHFEEHAQNTFASLNPIHLREVWREAVDLWRDSMSDFRRRLEVPFTSLAHLHPQGLNAALDAVLEGLSCTAADQLWVQARERSFPGSFLMVSLASNLPGLALQPLVTAMALRCPVLFKTSSTEPLSTAAFLRCLGDLEPKLTEVLACLTWVGGDSRFETPLFSSASHLFAYGDRESTEAVRQRFPERLTLYGPRFSVALVTENLSSEDTMLLARDIALFDQRGCLSVQTVFTTANAEVLARGLAQALEEISLEWPAGPLSPEVAGSCHQLRLEAQMSGHFWGCEDIRQGTVILDRAPEVSLSPGGRTVFIRPLRNLTQFEEWFQKQRENLQGIALSGREATAMKVQLHQGGVSHVAPLGRIQYTDASWRNGGRSILEILTAGGQEPFS